MNSSEAFESDDARRSLLSSLLEGYVRQELERLEKKDAVVETIRKAMRGETSPQFSWYERSEQLLRALGDEV